MNVLLRSGAIILGISMSIFGKEPPHPPSGGAYYSAQRPYAPPLPFNPFPEQAPVQLFEGIFVFDDMLIDYEYSMMTSSSESTAPPAPGPGTGGPQTPPYLPPTIPIPGVPLLAIEIIEGGVKRISFDSEPGIMYRIDECTDLSSAVWTEMETIVASETRSTFLAPEGPMRFYRVFKGDTTIQFPDWDDSIEQYLYFGVYSPVVGTYSLELYGDGVLEYSRSASIPVNGFFDVADGDYDPSLWPYTGYYGVNEWELRVTVTPAAGSGSTAAAPSTAQVKKKQLRRPANDYWGVTVQQIGIANPNTQAQEDLDVYMKTTSSRIFKPLAR